MNIFKYSASFCVSFALAISLPAFSQAELPSPRLDRIAPLGGMAGSSVDVEVQGPDLEEPQLIFDHPGLKAEAIAGKEWWFKVAIAADVPEGTYDCRVSGKYGISSPRLFAVAHGLVDVAEKEPNNTPEAAQRVELNVAVAGISDGNDQDVFRFTAARGQRLSIDCLAMRLDSTLDATMRVSGASGAAVASSGDYFGRDPYIDFIAPEAGEYDITVSDLSYRGGLPYRLVISGRPYVENVFPRAVQVDKSVELTVLGRNLGEGATTSAWSLFDKPLQERKLSVTGPADVLRLGALRFLEHPTQYSVAPTAATCTVTGWQIRPDCGGQAALNAVPLIVTGTEVTNEAEPNDNAAPQKLTLPAVVSGRFDAPRDADWYEIETDDAGGSYAVDVYCERIGGQADPYVVFVDDKGMRQQELDDFGHRVRAFDGHLRDPAGSINLNGKKKYRVLVQDRYQRGGARYQYVLSIRKQVPDFYVAAIHSQNPGPAGTNIWRGGAESIDIVVHYQGGFTGPITLTASNLPQGVQATPTTLGNNNSGAFVLWAAENAQPFTGPIQLFATAELPGGEKITREVRPHARVWQNGDGSSRAVQQHWIAVREKAPFSLQFAESRLTATAGSKIEAKLKLKRLSPDFKEPLNVLDLSWPGNFKMNNLQFSGDATEVTIPIEVQANTRPGDYTLSVLGQGQVPFTKKADGSDKKNTLVSLPSQPITITVIAAPK